MTIYINCRLNIELNEEDNYNHIVRHQQNEEYNTYYGVYDPQNEVQKILIVVKGKLVVSGVFKRTNST